MKNSTKWTIGIIAVVVIVASVIFGSTKLQKGDIRVGADNAAVVIGRITNELSKYNITVSDPDGLKSISIKNKKSATVTSGNPNNCPANKVLSSVNIKDVEFPLSVVVTDCNNKRVTVAPIPMPPVPTQPDLTVDQISVTYVPDQWGTWLQEPADPLLPHIPDGKNYVYDVSVTVKNEGNASTPSNSVVRVRLSDAYSAYISDITLPSIAAAAVSSHTVRLLTQGQATSAFALVDKNNSIAESNETNNTKNVSISPVLLPNLIIESITFSTDENTSVETGQILANFTIKNVGDKETPAGQNIIVGVDYEDRNPKPSSPWTRPPFDANFAIVADSGEVAFDIGESRTFTRNLMWHESGSEANVTANIDKNLFVDEHNEKDNEKTATKPVEPLIIPPPDVDIDTNVDADIDTDDEEFLPSRLPF